jgi:tetratricopeptide (TPR) repeat protein
VPENGSHLGIFRPEDGGRPDGSPEAAYAAARGRLEEGIARDPNDGEARLELGSLASFAGDLETAETHLCRAVEIMPENPRAHLRLGDVLYETARLVEAAEHYREAARLLSSLGKDGTPLADEARVELELAERELALVYRPLEDAEDAAESGEPGAGELNRLGGLRLAAGMIDEAAEAFRRALDADADSLQAALNFGFIQGLAVVEPSHLKRSVTELNAAVERFPDEPRLYLHLAELYEASSLYDAAVARIEKALDVAPGCLEACDMAARYVMLGGGYEERLGGKIEGIVATAEAAHESSPEDRDNGKALALAYLGRERFRRSEDGEGLARARELLEEVAVEDDDAAVRLAECWERLGDSGEARRLLERLAERSPGSARAAFELGGLCLRTGRPAEAVEHFARALAVAPEEAAFHQSLRYTLSGARKLRTAELLSRAELAHDPRSVGAHLELGRAYLDAMKVSEAAKVLATAAELAPERPDVRAELGKALGRAGRPEEAEAELRRALELDPGLPEAHRWLGSLLLELPGRMREGLAELEEYRRLSDGR